MVSFFFTKYYADSLFYLLTSISPVLSRPLRSTSSPIISLIFPLLTFSFFNPFRTIKDRRKSRKGHQGRREGQQEEVNVDRTSGWALGPCARTFYVSLPVVIHPAEHPLYSSLPCRCSFSVPLACPNVLDICDFYHQSVWVCLWLDVPSGHYNTPLEAYAIEIRHLDFQSACHATKS
jgi:hypothetical protein